MNRRCHGPTKAMKKLILSLVAFSLLSVSEAYNCGPNGRLYCNETGITDQLVVVNTGIEGTLLAQCTYIACPAIRVQTGGRLRLLNVSFVEYTQSMIQASAGSFVTAENVRFLNADTLQAAAIQANGANIILNHVEASDLRSRLGGSPAAFELADSNSTVRNLLCTRLRAEQGLGTCALINGGKFTCDNCTFRDSTNRLGVGGALSLRANPAVLTDCLVEGNWAREAGALEVRFGNAEFIRVRIQGNLGNESILVLDSESSLTLRNSTITGNKADTGGIMKVMEEGELTVLDTSVTENTLGGGLQRFGTLTLLSGGRLRVQRSVISGNVASSVGGVYAAGGSQTTLSDARFLGNIGGSANSLRLDPSSVTTFNGTLTLAPPASSSGAFDMLFNLSDASQLIFQSPVRASTGSDLRGALLAPNVEVAQVISASIFISDFPALRAVNGVPRRLTFTGLAGIESLSVRAQDLGPS